MNLQDWKTYGRKVLNQSREYYVTLKNEVQAYYSEKKIDQLELKEHLSERSLSRNLLHISLVAFFLKAVHCFVKREWLAACGSGVASVLAFPGLVWSATWGSLASAWLTLCGLSWLVMPALCGIAMTVITWYTVFLDSCIPGVYPPSPLSPSKSRFRYPNTFHLGYIIALVNGLALMVLMYVGNNK